MPKGCHSRPYKADELNLSASMSNKQSLQENIVLKMWWTEMVQLISGQGPRKLKIIDDWAAWERTIRAKRAARKKHLRRHWLWDWNPGICAHVRLSWYQQRPKCQRKEDFLKPKSWHLSARISREHETKRCRFLFGEKWYSTTIFEWSHVKHCMMNIATYSSSRNDSPSKLPFWMLERWLSSKDLSCLSASNRRDNPIASVITCISK